MSAAKPVIYDGNLARQLVQGDLMCAGEVINNALTTVGSGTILGSMLATGILNRTGPAGAFTDTTDTAGNIIAAIFGGINNTGLQNGTTFRLTYINSVAFAATLAAGTGVTLGANTGIAASSVKDYLVTVTNGTPLSVQIANQTNASAVITGMTQAQTNTVAVGQLVTGTNIPAAATVISIQSGIGVTLSAAATASITSNALTFSPTLRIDSLGQKLL